MDDNRQKIIAVDFDGTIVKSEEDPHLLTDFTLQPHAKEVLAWINEHFFSILWTCREDDVLQNALNYLDRNDIEFHAINENAPFVDFETSDKIFADFYVDDRTGIGIDWLKIQQHLKNEFLKPVDGEKIIKQVIIEVK